MRYRLTTAAVARAPRSSRMPGVASPRERWGAAGPVSSPHLPVSSGFVKERTWAASGSISAAVMGFFEAD